MCLHRYINRTLIPQLSHFLLFFRLLTSSSGIIPTVNSHPLLPTPTLYISSFTNSFTMAFSVDLRKVLIFICLLIPAVWYSFEGYITWILKREWIFYLSNRDYLTTALFLIPWIIGHMATIWGHYYRAEREFQHSIAKVTTPASVRQKISLWERHIFWGYTVKYWILVGALIIMKIGWVLVSVLPRYKRYYEKNHAYGGTGCKLPCFYLSFRVQTLSLCKN